MWILWDFNIVRRDHSPGGLIYLSKDTIMLNNKVVKPGIVLSVCFAALTVATGLTSCGGSVGDNSGKPQVKTTVHAYATPTLVAYGGTAKITWTSTDSNSCSTTPTSKIATGTGIGIAGEFTTTALTENTTFTISCAGDTGTRNQPVTVFVGSTSIIAAAACTPYPPLTGTTYYYCDCGTGADADCINHIGKDTNTGTDIASPRRTIEDAMTRFNSMAANETVALCKGGAFDTPSISIGASRCSAGSTCNDLRDYSVAGFSSTAKPIINFSGSSATIDVSGNKGGVRLLNLSLKGNGTNEGFFYYEGAHDAVMCNLNMDNFTLPVYINTQVGVAAPNNITLTGSTITNSTVIGFLGGANNVEISYNNWEGNGSNNQSNHTLYFASSFEISNMTVVGNYIHGQYGPKCSGSSVEGHGEFNGFLFKDNFISIDADKTSPGCWGLSLNNITGDTNSLYLKNLVVSGNTVINGGNLGIQVNVAPGAIIENNIVIQNWPYGGATGMNIPGYAARSANGDLISTANVIRNNTVWFGPNATGANVGIATNTEGTNHVVSNNAVSSAQTTGSLNCFKHDLPLASYAFINNNHCYSSSVSNKFEATRGTLAKWQEYATSRGFDSASITGTDPMFIAAGTNFRPVGGPLVGHGSNDPRYMSERDITDTLRPVAPAQPAIGAYEP
jgi:hypothetical protein